MIATLVFAIALLALAGYVLHLRATLACTREELMAAQYNVAYYQELYYGAYRIRTQESMRREGPTAYATIESLTQSGQRAWEGDTR